MMSTRLASEARSEEEPTTSQCFKWPFNSRTFDYVDVINTPEFESRFTELH